MQKKDCAALILAAGKSQRMGSPKLFLKMPDGKSFLENLLIQYTAFGCTQIVVVVNKDGYRQIQMNAIHLPPTVEIAVNHHPEFGRFFSIQSGLQVIHSEYTFVQNIDNPYANKEVLEKLFEVRTAAEVIKPSVNGRKGHPVLISKSVTDQLVREKNKDSNFKEILNNYSNKLVSVNDDTILYNINKHEEYLEFYHRKAK